MLEVGGTPIRKSIEYCGRCKGASVYVKDESKNPFGTFKDRRCAAVLEKHRSKKELVLVHITSGNSGYSLGMLAKAKEAKDGQKIQVVNVVPKGLPKQILKMLQECSIVHQMDLGTEIITHEMLSKIARERTGFGGPDDAIVGVEDYFLSEGYRKIVREILFSDIMPTHIFCPVGEGELAVEIASAAQEIWGDGAPKVIGVTIRENIFASGEEFMRNPGRNIADKLVNGYSKFRELWAGHVERGKAELLVVGEREIADEYAHLNRIGISAEPSAAVAFCGAVKYDLKGEDVAIVINSGKGVYEHGAVDKLWRKRLRRAARYIAVAALSIAITVGGFIWKSHVESEKRFLELQRQELMMQLEFETINRLEEDTISRLDRNLDGSITHEEFLELLRVLPNRSTDEARDPLRDYIYEIENFTGEELRYFLEYKELERAGGNPETRAMQNMERNYRARMHSEKSPTIKQRYKRLSDYRRVRMKLDDGTFCTFRDFDVNNPYDPSVEEQCD